MIQRMTFKKTNLRKQREQKKKNTVFFILEICKDSQFNNTKIKKNSEIQIQNKTQTLRKSYTFLNRVCARREHININYYKNNNNNNNNNNKIKLN